MKLGHGELNMKTTIAAILAIGSRRAFAPNPNAGRGSGPSASAMPIERGLSSGNTIA